MTFKNNFQFSVCNQKSVHFRGIRECYLSQNPKPPFYYRVIDTAASKLTKTAFTVTAIFIVALGYDLWYYILSYAGVIQYRINTPVQKIGKISNLFSKEIHTNLLCSTPQFVAL